MEHVEVTEEADATQKVAGCCDHPTAAFSWFAMSKAKSTSTTERKGCIDRLPIGTDLLGVDGEGYEHHFSKAYSHPTWTVFVRFEDDIVYEQELQPGTLSQWVEHIEAKRGWQTLNYADGTALTGNVEPLVAAMEGH